MFLGFEPLSRWPSPIAVTSGVGGPGLDQIDRAPNPEFGPLQLPNMPTMSVRMCLFGATLPNLEDNQGLNSWSLIAEQL